MGARYYQPGTGRFTQLDPLSCTIDDGQRYSYTMGNPANYVDPEGTYHCRPRVLLAYPYYTYKWYDRVAYSACVYACWTYLGPARFFKAGSSALNRLVSRYGLSVPRWMSGLAEIGFTWYTCERPCEVLTGRVRYGLIRIWWECGYHPE